MKRLDNIEEVRSLIKDNTFSFLYISTMDCNVCKGLLPKVEELLQKFPRIESRYVEANEVKEVSGELSAFSAPVLLLFIEGREAVRETRYVNLAELEDKIARYYSMLEE